MNIFRRHKIVNFAFLLFFCLTSKIAFAQIDTTGFNKGTIQYADFLSIVGKNNIGYAAERFNINIVEADIESAKVFPDPELGFGWFDHGERRMQMGYGFQADLNWTITLGGKRNARIELAKSENEVTKHLVQDYFRNLRADATLSFLDALQNKLLLKVQLESYQSMRQIAFSDSIRFKLGTIAKTNAKQSKLEASMMLNDVFQAEADWKSNLADLNFFVSLSNPDSLLLPTGDFSKFDRTFSLTDLIITAQNNRADLLAALQNKDVSEKHVQLAKANRVMDLGVNTGVEYNSYAANIVAPTPSTTTISAGISIPLQFSNKYAGELKTAQFAQHQADLLYQQVELQIQNEIIRAYYQYIAAQKQVQQFDNELLSEAKAVLDGKSYSYQRGETNLLEVLDAQRTYIEIQESYYQALHNQAARLVELERAAGIWDIDF